ncbi:alpha-ketoacid dehydrogenase subunit beta [Actinobacteria bacterium YIM 96077]|uniref:Alpha-ketoacid dehydrogenase subunit beta n=1 Tax=Phytoactinopolyspora halophila TaxID=1981511 RepID=A0A329R2R4_9ACTN|nr:alpha-ketoacid dehydrogenase subunit beta [Phytoactinopolyspora halophila]AYY11783.1 alpha-ketoacid dehydrogenase subunit beta [Actinobacteria bacterium YIM 96077]RAW17782.1 alpha-ketoacid dehydrogenase subunit beta [Phytoactinopolyspora halophila]
MVTMVQALNRALGDAMRADPSVVVFGEDVGTLGGVFRVTDGLTKEFGPDRCFDTPLAESGIVGVAVGMAMQGLRPVVEMQFDAFAYPAFEQVASHVAKLRNRTRGAVQTPIVIRVPYGGGIGGVEHHSDSSEGLYAQVPGLKVSTPATVSDAYVLLREAIADPDPVVFFEPKRLYWSTAEIDLPASAPGSGRAEIRRPGSDVTLMTYGPSVPLALEAADAATAELGLDVEVLDLRTLVPLDEASIIDSISRTGRGVVVTEAPSFAGPAAEIAALAHEHCFYSLAAPIRRVTGLDIPYPPPAYEHHYLPSVERILDTLLDLEWEEPFTRAA